MKYMELEKFYTYAFLELPKSTLNLPQGMENQLILVNGTEISAIIEPCIDLESDKNHDEKIIQMALTHDRVICQLHAQITVLPLRFGTYFSSITNVLNHLTSHKKEYQDKLRKISGKTEYTLKMKPHAIEELVPIIGGGRDYFLAKKQQYQSQNNFMLAQAAEKENLIDLITKVDQFPVFIQEQEQEEVRIYILVSNQDQFPLLEKFLYWQNLCPRWDLILGDNLPPYHFI